MRVSMSAMGSVMLMRSLLPARLDDAGDFTLHRVLAQLVAAEPELAEVAAGPSRDRATVAQAGRVGVARQPLQREPRVVALLVRHLRVVDDRLQRRAPLRVLRDELHALVLAVDQCKLRHGSFT